MKTERDSTGLRDWTAARSLGDRLRWAIDVHQLPEDRSSGQGLLIRKLEAIGESIARPTLRDYLENRTWAPIPFIEIVAKTLGLSAEWLAFGTGAPTAEHATAMNITAATVQHAPGAVNPFFSDATSHGAAKDFRDAVLTALGLPVAGEGAPVPAWVVVLGTAWVRFLRGGSSAHTVKEIQHRAVQIARAVAMPVLAMDVDPVVLQRSGLLTDYVVCMTTALMKLGEVQAIANKLASMPRLEAPPRQGKTKAKKRRRQK